MHRKGAIAVSIVPLMVMALNMSAASAAKRAARDGCTATALRAAADDARRDAGVAILCLVNRERTKRGLAAVRLSQPLSRSASAHSEDMAQNKFFSHVGSGDTSPQQRVERSGYMRGSHKQVAEAIAWASTEFATPVGLMRSLMGSAGHRRIILDGRFRDIGVGLANGVPLRGISGDGATLTLVLGRRR